MPLSRRLLLLTLLLALSLARPARAQGVITDTPPEARRALVIGAASYKSLPALRLAALDATDFTDFLHFRFGFAQNNITTLADIGANPPPTHVNMAVAFEKLIAETTPQSSVVIFFSGHGLHAGDEDYLLPIDAVSSAPEDAQDNGIAIGDFIRRLEARRPRSLTLFLDGSRKLAGLGAPGIRPGPRTAVYYAAGPGEQSYDGKQNDFNRGVFARFVVRALNIDESNAADAKGEVSAGALKSYLQTNISQYVSGAHGAKQNPAGAVGDPSMVLVKLNP